MRYRISKDANQDLDEIFLYWAERAGLKVADRLVNSIVDRFWLLGEYPDAGKTCDHIAAGLKCFPAGKYLIYYRKAQHGSTILHVFHGVRDQKRAFRKTPKRE
jgi:toxin ParE1/3/4